MGFENPITFLLEKLNEVWLAILHPFIILFNAIKTGFEASVNFPAEKLRQLWLAICHMFQHLTNWLHAIMKSVETGFVDAINFPAEKLKEVWFTMVHAWDLFVRWLQKVFEPEIWEDRLNHWLKFVQKLALDDTWYPFLTWFDRVFPPETRAERLRHWIQVGFPFVALAVVLGLIIYCCTRWPSSVIGAARRVKAACGWCWQIGVKKIYYWCRGGGVKAVKMMKAPGRNMMIARSGFEADPKAYFRKLRARPDSLV